MRVWSLTLPALVLALLAPAVAAQDGGPLRWRVRAFEGVLDVEVGDLVGSGELAEALRDGFPLRASLVVTLWEDGFVDRRVGGYEWRASVRSQGSDAWTVEAADAEPTQAVSLDAVRGALARRLEVPVRPSDAGRYYYHVALEVESLSPTDLQALEAWLQGQTDPEPAEEDEGSLTRGVRRLFVRALGLPRRTLERRTTTFAWTP